MTKKKDIKWRSIGLYIVIGVLTICNIVQFVVNNINQLPVDIVPDEQAALQVAETYLVGIYGQRVLDERPFCTIFDERKNTWVIHGTLPPDYVGGVASITIRKADGKVLDFGHGM